MHCTMRLIFCPSSKKCFIFLKIILLQLKTFNPFFKTDRIEKSLTFIDYADIS